MCQARAELLASEVEQLQRALPAPLETAPGSPTVNAPSEPTPEKRPSDAHTLVAVLGPPVGVDSVPTPTDP
jgi:hypothetical protein